MSRPHPARRLPDGVACDHIHISGRPLPCIDKYCHFDGKQFGASLFLDSRLSYRPDFLLFPTQHEAQQMYHLVIASHFELGPLPGLFRLLCCDKSSHRARLTRKYYTSLGTPVNRVLRVLYAHTVSTVRTPGAYVQIIAFLCRLYRNAYVVVIERQTGRRNHFTFPDCPIPK
jgi:hypothetical protein